MQNTTSATRDLYRERLTPSLWLFVAGALAGPMAAIVFIPVGAAVAIAVGVLIVIVVLGVTALSSATLRVTDGVLYAGRAHIDVNYLGDPQALSGEEAQHARGPGIDTRGWYLIRGGIDGLVLVQNTDPDDPVTSWALSSRTPDRLAAAIRRAQLDAHS